MKPGDRWQGATVLEIQKSASTGSWTVLAIRTDSGKPEFVTWLYDKKNKMFTAGEYFPIHARTALEALEQAIANYKSRLGIDVPSESMQDAAEQR